MTQTLYETYLAVSPSQIRGVAKPIFAVLPVPNHYNYFVGKDSEGHACLLIVTVDQRQKRQPPIRLENLEVQFELLCHLRKGKEIDKKGTFNVIRCRSFDNDTIRYFLSVCEIIIRIIGEEPSQLAVTSSVQHLAEIFQQIQKPPARPANGLFGELFVIWRSSNPIKAIEIWRLDTTSRYDFADGEIRLDVKTTAGRNRLHKFSYEQCNPPPGTIAVVASLFTERSHGGISLQSLINKVEDLIGPNTRLLFKLHEVVASTLGINLHESMALSFDLNLAESSLCFYNLSDVPAIRGSLPVGISNVHFQSDLSNLDGLSIQYLIDCDPAFRDILPH